MTSLLLSRQSRFGLLYGKVGLAHALPMLGLAAGGPAGRRRPGVWAGAAGAYCGAPFSAAVLLRFRIRREIDRLFMSRLPVRVRATFPDAAVVEVEAPFLRYDATMAGAAEPLGHALATRTARALDAAALNRAARAEGVKTLVR